MKDFFISYNGKDKSWAEWIAYQLEEAGYTTVIQAWDFRPGGNFVLEMQKATVGTERTLIVLSQHYLDAEYTQPEWAAAFVKDPKGIDRKLVPMRVAECSSEGLLAAIIYIDLVSKDEQTAVETLLAGVKDERPKPKSSPPFPGQSTSGLTAGRPKPEFPGSLTVRSNLPYARNPFFTGREKVLEQLHDAVTSVGATALTQPQTISGLGGIGKTQTVVEYAYRHSNDYKAVFWASAATELALSTSFVEIAKLVNLPEKDAQNQDDTVRAVKRWLENSDGWLLIFDNADKPESVKAFLPHNHKGHVLLTSRAQVFDMLGVAKPIKMQEMAPEEAVEFLFKRTGRDGNNPAESNAAAKLAEELGYLPLALEQAGAYIIKKQCSFQDYLVSYRARGLKLLEKARAVTGDYPKSVATTWSLNFEQVEQVSKAAADLLRVSAFLNPDKIPLELITLGSRELGPVLSAALANVEADPLALDEVLEPLTQYSLIRRDRASQTYDIHRLVQAVLKDEMDKATQRLWAERAMRVVNRAFPFVKFSTWQHCERLLPHAQACAELIEKQDLEFSEAARLLNQAGFYLHERARYAEAAPLSQRALAILEKALGPEHPNVATSLNNLAELYRVQGQYTEAEPLSQRALTIRERALGPEHPDVATSLNNLALLYRAQGQYTETEPLSQRALAIRERALGPEHPDVAQSLNNLAELYRAQGQYTKAEPLYQRALAISEKALGPEHPNVATSLNNLAGLYYAQGQYTEAAPLYQRALAIREKALGPEHPDVAHSLNNLAGLYRAQGQYTKAEPLYQRALAIREKTLGPEHPDVATSLNNLAELYHAQGQYTKAAPLYQRALAIWEKALGSEHPRVATVLENYALLLWETNQKAKAAELMTRAQAIRAKHAEENPAKRDV